MSNVQKILFPILILAMLILVIVTWGSIASILFMFLLIMCPLSYIWQRFMNRDRDNDFMDDENG